MRHLTIFAAILILVSCSSSPKTSPFVNDMKNKASEYAEFGNTYYAKADFDQAMKFFILSRDMNILVDNEPGLVLSYNSLGKVYLAKGDIVSANEHFARALLIAEAIGNGLLTAQTLVNIGEARIASKEFQDAEETLLKALPLFQAEKDEASLAVVYQAEGRAARGSGDDDRALALFTQALAINTERELYKEMAANCYMIASIHSRKGELDLAADFAARALEYDRNVENSPGIASDLFAIGIIREKKGDLQGAYTAYQRSEGIYALIPLLVRDRVRVLQALEQSARSLGRTSDEETYKNLRETLEANLE